MSNLNTTNQSKDKITTVNGLWIGSLTCYNTNDEDSVNIQLTSLEEMWYGHEENIDHPSCPSICNINVILYESYERQSV